MKKPFIRNKLFLIFISLVHHSGISYFQPGKQAGFFYVIQFDAGLAIYPIIYHN